LCLARGITARLSVRPLKRFGSPENVFPASLRQLAGCETPAATAQAVFKKEEFKRAEKELPGIRAIPGCQLVNWSEPEYPQMLLQIYDPPVPLYAHGDAQILNAPSLPGNVTQAVSFAPNLFIKQGTKLVTCAQDVIEELPTPGHAALTKLEQPEAEQRNLLVAQSLFRRAQAD
jgi:predicted Rossmann fold nucleotide-binding protein DprA/Smf involved in DNA uptake